MFINTLNKTNHYIIIKYNILYTYTRFIQSLFYLNIYRAIHLYIYYIMLSRTLVRPTASEKGIILTAA